MDDDILYELHFYESYDESLYLTKEELEEWFDYLLEFMQDESKSKWFRLQKLIYNITEP